MTPTLFPTRTTALLALATLLSAAPWHLTLAPEHGTQRLAAAQALARGGDDDSAGRGGGSDDSNRGGDDRGSGNDDRGGGDHGGRGNDDKGDESRGRDDDSDGDSRRGSDDDDGNRDKGSEDSGRRGADDRKDDSPGDGSREATLSDGTRIEIENGRVEIKDPGGRTIVERPATAADRARLDQAMAAERAGAARTAGSGAALPPRAGTRGGGLVAGVEVSGENIGIRYADGWKEEIEDGRYQLKDELNRTVIARPVRASDRTRLFAAVR